MKYYQSTRKSCPRCNTKKSVHLHVKRNWSRKYPQSPQWSDDYEFKKIYCSNCSHNFYLKRRRKK